MKKRIIDKRKKEKFMVDDEYFNGQAKLCGWKATIVYYSLCRYANKDQECFPSIKLMADINGVSRGTIIKGIISLEKNNIIEVNKKRNKKQQWLNNTYILIDKSEWKYLSQVDDSDTAKRGSQVHHSANPSPPQRKPKSTSATLRKHIEGNIYKETYSIPKGIQAKTPEMPKKNKYGNTLINEMIVVLKEFVQLQSLDGSIKKNRYACKRVIDKIKKEFKARSGKEPRDKAIIDSLRIILEKTDDFHQKNITGFEYIDRHFAAIVKSSYKTPAIIEI